MGTGLISCQEKPTSAEKVYVDTLYFKLKGDLKALNIDPQELQARKDELVHTMYPMVQDTFGDLRSAFEDDFNGMRTAYDTYLNKHLLYTSATNLLIEEVEEFRKDVDADALSRAEFKERYNALLVKVKANNAKVEEIAKPVYDLEPMWIRLKLKFDPKRDRRDSLTSKK